MSDPSTVTYPEPDPVATTERFLNRIEEGRALNAFITVTEDHARERARESEVRIREGNAGALEGVAIAVKDNFCTEGIRTTAASRMLGEFIPPYESFVTGRLRDAGAVLVGKANMDEFGLGSSTENSAFGPTVNPNVPADGAQVVPGGSSGGSAAAVAAGMCAAAVGSDTGGSLRQPAAFCGIVGFKPTYGLCSRSGLIAYASSLDQPGLLTHRVADLLPLLDVIVGQDPSDSTSLAWLGPRFSDQTAGTAQGVTLGIPKELMELSAGDELARLWTTITDACQSAGYAIKYVSIPTLKVSLSTYYLIALCELSSNLARYDGVRYGHRTGKSNSIKDMIDKSRAEGFGAETKRRIMLGTYALSAGYYDQYYLQATRVRQVLEAEFAAAFQEVDFMVWPTTPTSAFDLGAHQADPYAMYLEDIFTVPVNLIGSPGISIPAMRCSRNLPMGMQIIGPRLSDDGVLRAALKLEEVLQFSGGPK